MWIGLHEPTPEEFDAVSEEFALHELAVEDAIKAHQRPKLERYGDVSFLVLKTARYVEPDEIEFGEILLFVGDDFVVSVRHGEGVPLHGVRVKLEHRPELLSCGPMAVVYAILDEVVDAYAPVMDALDRDIDEVEREVFAGDRQNPARRIYELKREAIDFARAVTPLVEPIERMTDGNNARAGGAHDLLPRRARPPDSAVGPYRGARASSSRACSRRTWPRSGCGRTRTCARSRPGWRSSPCRR